MLNSLQNGWCSFIITILLVHTTTPSISFLKILNSFLFFSQFLLSIYLSIILTISINKSLLLYLRNFSPPYFCIQTSQQSTPEMFSLTQPYNQFTLREETRELGSLVRTDTILLSSFLIKVWTVIAGLTTTDSLSPRLRKLVYCK